jgi:hypothetical protein
VGATESIAQSHAHYATRIEADVERPLREFTTNNREVQAMGNIQGNLTAIAKDIDAAQKKQGKLRDKGPKAKASAVADAVQDIERAELQWDSQAPYVFEQLQAIDETRLNHLRDVLTQFQTHEVDQVERSRATAEETLNAMLNIETADEIQTWSLRMRSGEGPQPSRKLSATATPARNLAPPPIPGPASPTAADDNRSQKSGSVPEKHSSNPLKRFGTVLGRRRQSAHPYGRATSPERKSSTNNLGSAFGSFGKGKAKNNENLGSSLSSTAERPTSPLRRLSQRASASVRSDSPSLTRQASTDAPNGTIPELVEETSTAGPTNGAAHVQDSIPELKEPLSPPPAAETQPEPEKDAEGFSVPPSAVDAITEAEREAGL